MLPGFETATATDELLVEIQAGSGVLSNDYPGGQGSDDMYGYYRYGFNGKENDNEVKGQGNQQDYGMRIYDPRLGRFLSVDPLTKGYPWYTPYQFAGNGPILFIDLDGAEPTKNDINYGQNLILGRVNHKSLTNAYLRNPTTPTPYIRDNKNWLSFPEASSDFKGAANTLFEFKKNNPKVKVKNIVLSAHGGSVIFQGSLLPQAGLRFNGDDPDKSKYITAAEIATYQKNPDELNEDDREAINNLSGIINSIENNGNLIIKGCQGDVELTKAIISLVKGDKSVNVYFTEDKTTTADALDTRLINEGESTWSKDKNSYINRGKTSDFENGFSVLRGSGIDPERLKKNIILNSQGAAFSIVPESKTKTPKRK